MLYACFYTICLVFRYTSWHFYAFSGTNLLTRYHSVSFLFFAIFVFQKSYIKNILGIGWNKSQTSRNLPKLPENWRGDGKELGGSLTNRGCGPGPGRTALWWAPLPRSTSDSDPSPIKTPQWEKPKDPITFRETHRDLEDYGSIAVARWLSSPPYASCLDLMSCFTWSRLPLCNYTCCVCWDLMNISVMIELMCWILSYVISILFMILHALHC
jgi:hypothetical protein